jgi:hypothetical protein
MCCDVPLALKAERAPGLPNSIKFIFLDPTQDKVSEASDNNAGLRFMTEKGRLYRSLEMFTVYRQRYDAEVFCKFVGVHKNTESLQKAQLDIRDLAVVQTFSAGVDAGATSNAEEFADQIDTTQHDWSDKKIVGARCYARWSNGEFFWGYISRVYRRGKQKTFGVHFDDGDKLSDIPEDAILTEVQYVREESCLLYDSFCFDC